MHEDILTDLGQVWKPSKTRVPLVTCPCLVAWLLAFNNSDRLLDLLDVVVIFAVKMPMEMLVNVKRTPLVAAWSRLVFVVQPAHVNVGAASRRRIVMNTVIVLIVATPVRIGIPRVSYGRRASHREADGPHLVQVGTDWSDTVCLRAPDALSVMVSNIPSLLNTACC
jgi:hypothetical protein